MAHHTEMFVFNLMYLIGFRALLSLIPSGQTPLAGIPLKWDGITIPGVNGLGAFDFGTIALNDYLFIVAPVIISVVAICIVGTIKVVGSGLEFNPFKLLALVLGIIFSASIGGSLLYLTPTVPFIIQSFLIFPFVIMLLYSLIMDVGDML